MTKKILVKCTCTRCGAQALSLPETQHRRCGGGREVPPRPKADKLARVDRGQWAPA